jgi:DtxR family Mn-dependent transcriptional regulator
LEQYIEAIADRVQVSRPAASRAVRELADKCYVEHRAYGYVGLTQRGYSLAEILTAHHKALYEFLTEILGYDEDWADQEACRFEHQVEDKLVARLGKLRQFFVEDGDTQIRWQQLLEKTQ